MNDMLPKLAYRLRCIADCCVYAQNNETFQSDVREGAAKWEGRFIKMADWAERADPAIKKAVADVKSRLGPALSRAKNLDVNPGSLQTAGEKMKIFALEQIGRIRTAAASRTAKEVS